MEYAELASKPSNQTDQAHPLPSPNPFVSWSLSKRKKKGFPFLWLIWNKEHVSASRLRPTLTSLWCVPPLCVVRGWTHTGKLFGIAGDWPLRRVYLPPLLSCLVSFLPLLLTGFLFIFIDNWSYLTCQSTATFHDGSRHSSTAPGCLFWGIPSIWWWILCVQAKPVTETHPNPEVLAKEFPRVCSVEGLL